MRLTYIFGPLNINDISERKKLVKLYNSYNPKFKLKLDGNVCLIIDKKKKLIDQRSGFSTEKIDQRSGFSTEKIDQRSGFSTEKIDQRSGFSTEKITF
jgi:hypothetical protein